MALLQNDHAKGRKQVPVPAEYGVVVVGRFEIDLASAPAGGDIIEIGALPANATVVDAILDVDEMDGGTALALNVGLMSGDYQENDEARTCGTELFAADTTAQSGGIARMSAQTGFRIEKTQADRGIGVEVDTAAGTFQAGKIRLLVSYIQA